MTKNKKEPSTMEFIGVLATFAAFICAFVFLMHWLEARFDKQPECYFDRITKYVSNDSEENKVYKRVYVNCPQ